MTDLDAELDWEQFRDRFFPLSRRHDLQAISAYDTYRRNGSVPVDQGGTGLSDHEAPGRPDH